MPYIGDFFEIGYTRAGALSARSCHFWAERSTVDVRAVPNELIRGLWVVFRASRRVRARGGFTAFLHHSSLADWGSRRSARDKNFGRGFRSRIERREKEK